MVTSLLCNFLKTGNLGDLSIGMELKDVLKLLGHPDNFYSAFNTAKANASFDVYPLYYGILEILVSFDREKIEFFKIYFLEERSRTIPSTIDDGWVKQIDGITKAEFSHLLNECGIQAKRRLIGNFRNRFVTEVWIPSSQIQVNFNEEDGKDELLVMFKSGPKYESKDLHIGEDCVDFA